MCEFPNYFLRLKDKYDIKFQLTGVHAKLIFLSSVKNVNDGNYKLSYDKDHYDLIVRDCGQCATCRFKSARAKAVQIQCESRSHKDNCFITLTFGNEKIYDYFISEGYSRSTAERRVKLLTWSLEKKLFQKFMKRLRFNLEQEYLKEYSVSKGYFDNYTYDKSGQRYIRQRVLKKDYYDYSDYNPPKIKFYHCGEYGEKNSRPHHHAIILGWKPPKDDIYYEKQYSWKRKREENVSRSKTLDKLWKLGNNQIGTATYQSMNYVARYCTKKIKGRLSETYYNGRMPEYETASNREGLGLQDFLNNYIQYISNRGIHYKDVDGNLKLAPLPNYFKVVLRRYYPVLYREFSKKCYEYSDKYNKLSPAKLMSKARRQSVNTAGIQSTCCVSEFKNEYNFTSIPNYMIYENILKRGIFGYCDDLNMKSYLDIPELQKNLNWRQKNYIEFEKMRNKKITNFTNALLDFKFKHINEVPSDHNKLIEKIKCYQSNIDYFKNLENPYLYKNFNKPVDLEHLKEILLNV